MIVNNVVCLQCTSMLVCMKDELKEQDDGELEECIVQAAIRGFPLTAVEIAKGSPHPLEEKMLIVFDVFYMYFALTITHENRGVAEGLEELLTSRGHKIDTQSVGDTTANVYTLAGLRSLVFRLLSVTCKAQSKDGYKGSAG